MTDIIEQGIHRSPEELLNVFHQAAAVGDLQAYFGAFCRNGRFLGTDASENWPVEEFLEFSRPHFRDGKGWTYIPRLETRVLSYYPSVESPIFATFDELLDSPSFPSTCRGSGSLCFNSDKQSWYVVSYHLTFPIPNDIAKETCDRIATFEKKQRLKQATSEADKHRDELLRELDSEPHTSNKNTNTNTKSKKKK